MNATMVKTTEKMAQISVKRIYNHPIDKVWSALTDAEALSEWLMPVTGFELSRGKQFQFKTEPRGKFDGIVNCSIVDYGEPHFLQLTWHAAGMPVPTIVTWQLKDQGEGKTFLHLTHNGFQGLGGQFTRLILTFGWKGIMKKQLTQYLTQ